MSTLIFITANLVTGKISAIGKKLSESNSCHNFYRTSTSHVTISCQKIGSCRNRTCHNQISTFVLFHYLYQSFIEDTCVDSKKKTCKIPPSPPLHPENFPPERSSRGWQVRRQGGWLPPTAAGADDEEGPRVRRGCRRSRRRLQRVGHRKGR